MCVLSCVRLHPAYRQGPLRGVVCGDSGGGRHLLGVPGWTSPGPGTVKGKSWGLVREGRPAGLLAPAMGKGAASPLGERCLLACLRPSLSAPLRVPWDWGVRQGCHQTGCLSGALGPVRTGDGGSGTRCVGLGGPPGHCDPEGPGEPWGWVFLAGNPSGRSGRDPVSQ